MTTAKGDEMQKDLLNEYKSEIFLTVGGCMVTQLENLLGYAPARNLCGCLSGAVSRLDNLLKRFMPQAGELAEEAKHAAKKEKALKRAGYLRAAHDRLKNHPKKFGAAFGAMFGAIWCNCNETIRDKMF